MSKALKYVETNIAERYSDAAERIYVKRKRERALRSPGDLHLGPYLTVANSKLEIEAVDQIQKSAVCAIL